MHPWLRPIQPVWLLLQHEVILPLSALIWTLLSAVGLAQLAHDLLNDTSAHQQQQQQQTTAGTATEPAIYMYSSASASASASSASNSGTHTPPNGSSNGSTDEVLAMLASLKDDISDDRTKDRLERASTLLRASSPSSVHHNNSSGHLTQPSPPITRTNSAADFIKRTFSFARLPPMPPTPPATDVPKVPTKPFRPLRPLFKFMQRYTPDVYWAITSFHKVEKRPPKAGERRQIREAIMQSPPVLAAIKTSAEINGITIEQSAKNAEQIFETMAADMWMPAVRFMAYLMRKTFKLLYPFGIDVGGSEIQRVREASKKGPLLLMPNHKSYMDFLAISYICFQYKLPLPHVVSGDNLNFPVVGSFLRWGGAFFIKRTFSSSDPLYRTVFNEYITQLLIHGHAVECFIEGGRSRIGKVLPPKSGFLRGVLDAVVDRRIASDVYLVPISLGYDRLIENDSYIIELTGGKKRSEQLLSFIRSSWQLLTSTYNQTLNFGKINVGIGEPISLQQYIAQTLASLPESAGGPVLAASASMPLLVPLQAPQNNTDTDEKQTNDTNGHSAKPRVQGSKEQQGSGHFFIEDSEDNLSNDAASTASSSSAASSEVPEINNGPDSSAEEAGALASLSNKSSLAKKSQTDDDNESTISPVGSNSKAAPMGKSLSRVKATYYAQSTVAISPQTSSASPVISLVLPPGQMVMAAARKYMTNAVGYRILYDINKVTTVVPAALVGTILFTQYGRGIRDSELVKKVRWLRRQVIIRGGRVQMTQEESLHEHVMTVVNQVLQGKVKGHDNTLVKRHKDILMLSVYSPAERMELSLYRNQLIHLFVQEGIFLCAFYACEMQKNTYPCYVTKEEVTKASQYLSQLLKLEFIFKPSPGIEVSVDEVLNFSLQHGILQERKDESDSSKPLQYSVNDQLGTDGEYQGTYTYLFVCSLFWPFIDSYYLVALSCYRLLPDRMLEDESFVRFVQSIGEALYFEGLLDLYEAISSVTLNNALVLLENWGVIQFVCIESDTGSVRGGSGGKRIVQLTVPYRDEKLLEEIVLKLGSFRKRLAAYRSRRYRSRVNNQHQDAINVVKRLDMSSSGKIVK